MNSVMSKSTMAGESGVASSASSDSLSSMLQYPGGVPMEEVEKHATADSAWIVVEGEVYDCTPYLKDHPGGASSILIVAGQEATDDFKAVHSKKAWDMLRDFRVGPLIKASEQTVPRARESPVGVRECFLDPRKFQRLPLVEKIMVSHDTRIFRFGLPSPDCKLGLPTGKHIFLKAVWKGELVMRPYTPMTDDCTTGHVDFIVKVYFAGIHPKFPEGGKMSQHLESMAIGDTIEVKGPLGEIEYLGHGAFTWQESPQSCQRINLIAGGTGLSACWQLASAILRDPSDATRVSFIYANQTPDDILARKELDDLAKTYAGRFSVWYTVDRLPAGADWSYDVGFVNEAMFQQHLFEVAEGVITMMCGPPGMIDHACIPNLEKLGHKADSLFRF